MIGADIHRKLRRLQELLAREIPSGDPAAIIDRALTVLQGCGEGQGRRDLEAAESCPFRNG